MKTTKMIHAPGIFTYALTRKGNNQKENIISRMRRLATPALNQPVFRLCRNCNQFQFYDDKNGEWYDRSDFNTAAIIKKVPEFARANWDKIVKTSLCPPCREENPEPPRGPIGFIKGGKK